MATLHDNIWGRGGRSGVSYDRSNISAWLGRLYPTDKKMITSYDDDKIKLGLRDTTNPKALFEYETMVLTWRNPELEVFLRKIASKTQEDVGYMREYRLKGFRVTRLVVSTSGFTEIEIEGKSHRMEYDLYAGDTVHMMTGSKYKHPTFDVKPCYYKKWQDRNAELFKSPPGHTVVLIQDNGAGHKAQYGKTRKSNTLYKHQAKHSHKVARRRALKRMVGQDTTL